MRRMKAIHILIRQAISKIVAYAQEHKAKGDAKAQHTQSM